jgi:hypothetical protein
MRCKTDFFQKFALYACEISIQSDEKSYCASAQQSLCGVAFKKIAAPKNFYTAPQFCGYKTKLKENIYEILYPDFWLQSKPL